MSSESQYIELYRECRSMIHQHSASLMNALRDEAIIDVFRELNENETDDEDIYLDEFKDEIEEWVIEAIKGIGLDTAKSVLNAPREMIVEQADLEEDTVDHVLSVLRAEFEN